MHLSFPILIMLTFVSKITEREMENSIWTRKGTSKQLLAAQHLSYKDLKVLFTSPHPAPDAVPLNSKWYGRCWGNNEYLSGWAKIISAHRACISEKQGEIISSVLTYASLWTSTHFCAKADSYLWKTEGNEVDTNLIYILKGGASVTLTFNLHQSS